ncbi:uncharacterized protein TNCV_1151731 [Trichonephila clavipes]|nr:uncharacterized protein TNCV_1151731 [Trichonephila clavipes]
MVHCDPSIITVATSVITSSDTGLRPLDRRNISGFVSLQFFSIPFKALGTKVLLRSFFSPGYPIKNEYYGPSGYEYNFPVDEKYAGVNPYPEKRKGSKYGPLAFALGLLPLGLLLASLVPTVVTIPVTTTVATDRRRKRSVRFINPALEIISSYDMSALEDPVCMKQIFCEVVRDGKKETASIVQKFYFKLAYILDEKITEFMGMKGLVNAVRKDKCQEFHCRTNRKLSNVLPKNGTYETNA